MLKTFQKTISLFVAAVFVIAIFFCLNIGVNYSNNDSVPCCVPSSSRAAAYQIDWGKHLQHWQQAFIAIYPLPAG